jgi:hypothetical protein
VTNITFKVDLKTGTVEVGAPPEHFQEVLAGVKEVLEIGKTLPPVPATTANEQRGSEDSGAGSPGDTDKTSTEVGAPRRTRQIGGSSDRPGRIGSFEPVDLGLKEEQERRLRQFYAEKKPKEQVHQVAVAMYQGEKLLNRKVFSYNEIYTLLRLSGEKDLPKALDVVVARMLKDNLAIREKDGVALKFVGRDLVEKSLPSAE